jgi:hypothetical protein
MEQLKPRRRQRRRGFLRPAAERQVSERQVFERQAAERLLGADKKPIEERA